MNNLTSFQRDLLYIVFGLDGPNGQAIKDELENYYEEKISDGRLYPNLDTLVEKELINKGQHDRLTNKYTTTHRGNREIEARVKWKTQYIEYNN